MSLPLQHWTGGHLRPYNPYKPFLLSENYGVHLANKRKISRPIAEGLPTLPCPPLSEAEPFLPGREVPVDYGSQAGSTRCTATTRQLGMRCMQPFGVAHRNPTLREINPQPRGKQRKSVLRIARLRDGLRTIFTLFFTLFASLSGAAAAIRMARYGG